MSLIKDVKITLGPREVVHKGKVLGMVGTIPMDVTGATAEELADLVTAPVILLVMPITKRTYKGDQ